MLEIVPAALTTAIPVAVVPSPASPPGALKVTAGVVEYPDPPEVRVTIPIVLSEITVVAAAPTPGSLYSGIKTIPGAVVYP